MNPLKPVILCVDDEDANLKLLEKLLVPRGYIVVRAVSGKDALVKIKSQAIDLVLLDIIMPGMNGFEVCRQIKEDQKLRNIPVIMITASIAKQDRILGIEAGAEEFLSKPFDLAEVLARIKMLLKMKKLDDERKLAESQKEDALAALQNSHDELDRRVQERTAELAQANEMLQADIIKRKQIEKTLKKSEENFRHSLEDSPLGVRVVTAKSETIYANKVILDIYGYANVKELNKIPLKERYTPQSYAEFQIRQKARERGDSGPSEYEINIVRKNGEIRHLQVLRKDVLWNGIKKFQVIYLDITDRKRAEEALRESEEKYRTILEEMDDIYFETDLKGNITFVNPSSCKMSGYSEEELLGMSFKKISAPDDIEKTMQYYGEILLTGKTGKAFLWNLVKKNGEHGFSELVVSFIRDKQGKPLGFRGIGRDVTERKRAEEVLQQTLSSLRKAFGTTIQVMVSAVEMRDPYTAGHQLRAANLACAIATEVGLPKEKIDGIRMAGSIHDIGKISIPAEILSKPTKLTNVEFSLIKEHSRSGYEILKDVESQWPLAQIVYQHHERMDGSGYPRNLKGDEIIIEARIMAVADVVEAMASHRPYRPGLGIDSALAEIEKNKGTLYDNNIADACLRLFREKGFQLT
jgi:PAS domain S-box-containing protein